MTAIADRVVELRQYTLVPGRRDELIELFDRELIETQEKCGMRILGQFRDLDEPDHFVWLRSFADLPSRRDALAAFYGGPDWKAHGRAANATMIDSDNVLMLRPVGPTFDLPLQPRPPVGTAPTDRTYSIDVYERAAAPGVDAIWRTEPGENTFPALPVRLGEDVLITLTVGPPPPTSVPVVQRLRLTPTGRSMLR
jgi:hypothetical protein